MWKECLHKLSERQDSLRTSPVIRSSSHLFCCRNYPRGCDSQHLPLQGKTKTAISHVCYCRSTLRCEIIWFAHQSKVLFSIHPSSRTHYVVSPSDSSSCRNRSLPGCEGSIPPVLSPPCQIPRAKSGSDIEMVGRSCHRQTSHYLTSNITGMSSIGRSFKVVALAIELKSSTSSMVSRNSGSRPWCMTNATTTGPIVRISPYELHVIDPAFYDTLYNFNPELEKRRYQIGMPPFSSTQFPTSRDCI